MGMGIRYFSVAAEGLVFYLVYKWSDKK